VRHAWADESWTTNGQALDERALGAIGGQLDAVVGALQARGIEPGGTLALRLFA
jgi:hypothetical protein